jgi:hypothetical protein
MAPGVERGEPGKSERGITANLAGLGGRSEHLGFTQLLATAVGKGEPGT